MKVYGRRNPITKFEVKERYRYRIYILGFIIKVYVFWGIFWKSKTTIELPPPAIHFKTSGPKTPFIMFSLLDAALTEKYSGLKCF